LSQGHHTPQPVLLPQLISPEQSGTGKDEVPSVIVPPETAYQHPPQSSKAPMLIVMVPVIHQMHPVIGFVHSASLGGTEGRQ
jgi:hypothetical protein